MTTTASTTDEVDTAPRATFHPILAPISSTTNSPPPGAHTWKEQSGDSVGTVPGLSERKPSTQGQPSTPTKPSSRVLQSMRHALGTTGSSQGTEDRSEEEDEWEGSDWSHRLGSPSAPSTAQTSPAQPTRPPGPPSREIGEEGGAPLGPTPSMGPREPLQTYDDLLPTAARARPDLTDWAPSNQLPVFPKLSVPHLPDFLVQGSNAPTSLPIAANQVHMEMSDAINSLISEEVFAELMKDRLGRHRFREYLINTRGDVGSLDLWIDLTGFRALTKKVRTTAIALHDVFVVTSSVDRHPILTSELREDVVSSLRQGMHFGDSLEAPQHHLLCSLYESEFQAFIKHKLIEECHIRLGQLETLPGTGLGDAFCLTNPRLRDHPITLLSPGFERLTGYSVSMIAGRNCRMLAGPATSPVTSKRIHDALSRGEGINTLVLNYRRDGTPFFNLLCIIPLRDTYGHLTYFLGGQIEVTGSLAAGKSLSWLVGSDADPTGPMIDSEFSPTFQAYASAIATGARPGVDRRRELDPASAASIPRAGGEVPSGRQREFGHTPSSSTGSSDKKPSGLKSLLQSMGMTKKKQQHSLAGSMKTSGEVQQIGGAESLFSQKAAPVQLQIAQFASVYSKVIVFRRATRQILFVTAEFLGYCGIPSSKPSQIFNSDLILQDVLAIVTAPERGDVKATRRALKDAISLGQACSMAVGVKCVNRAINESMFVKNGMLHLSPLRDRERVVEAFVGVFS